MLRSFRARLLGGFAVVIIISLLLSAGGFALLLREQQADAAAQRIGLLVDPIVRRVQWLENSGWRPELIRHDLEQIAGYYHVRILLVDAGDRVVLDTDPEKRMLGTTIAMPFEGLPRAEEQMRSFHAIRSSASGEDLYLFTPADRSAQPAFPAAQRARLVIAVPAADVTAAWAALLPRLAIAGGAAGLFAVIVASLLASRITTPIAQMTRASQAMARGDLDQRVEGEGDDEIGVLAAAFNQMSSQVSRSNRVMRDLLANVSHDLKTPLTSIRGFSQALLDGLASDPDEATEMAVAINDEAERMRALVDDLIYLSEIESGTLQLSLDRLEIDHLIGATVRRFRYQAEEAGIALRCLLDGAPITADGRRIEQVLANLVENAIRFTPAGGEVVLRSRQSSGGVEVEVHNEGPPIPPDKLPMIFDRFHRVDGSRGDRHSGLGLSIVRELVQAHDGRVEVRSAEGEGTAFTVWLPGRGPRPAARARAR